MAKVKLGYTLENSLNEAKKKGEFNLKDAVITTPQKLSQTENNASKIKLDTPKEKRDVSGMTYLTRSEMDSFLSLIGRKSFSDAARELILDFTKKNKNR